jgi:dipeptidyl aminopeptidase/acylaminoacyl peptidase
MRTIKYWVRPVAFSILIILDAGVAARSQTATPSPPPAPPASDIFIVDLKNDGKLELGQPIKITSDAGYNNQPSFLPDGQSILYTSIKDKQADIYRYDIRAAATTQVTNTPESEYSPTLMPDGKHISVVRVEADGTQRLWKFPLAGGGPSLILENIKPVGYHLWIDDRTLALFILGKPNTLQLADVRTGKAEFIADNPGRILRRIPHQDKFSFVQKVSDQEWLIKSFDLKAKAVTTIIKTFPGVEDYAWTPGGLLLMARDSKLFVRQKTDWAWVEIGNFSNAGLRNITRIAVSPKGDRIAVVARSETRPQ